jgi:hypothetical protein
MPILTKWRQRFIVDFFVCKTIWLAEKFLNTAPPVIFAAILQKFFPVKICVPVENKRGRTKIVRGHIDSGALKKRGFRVPLYKLLIFHFMLVMPLKLTVPN